MNDLPENFDELTGREFLERIWAGPGASPLGLLLNMKLIEVGDGNATFEAIPSRKFYNPQQRCHGGFAAALVDRPVRRAEQEEPSRGSRYGALQVQGKYVPPT